MSTQQHETYRNDPGPTGTPTRRTVITATMAVAVLAAGCTSADKPHTGAASVTAATTATSTTGTAAMPAPRSTSIGPVSVPPQRPYPSLTGPARPVAVPGPATVNGTDASAVALAAVRALQSADTAVDSGPNATLRRGAAWLTLRFAARVRDFAPVAAPGAAWNVWASHKAYLQVATSLAGDPLPMDTATRAYRQVVAVLHPIGRDRWRGPAQTVVVFVTLARPTAAQPWRVDSAETS